MKIVALVIASLCVADAKRRRRRSRLLVPASAEGFIQPNHQDHVLFQNLPSPNSQRLMQLKKMLDYLFQNVNGTSPSMYSLFGYGCWCISHGENPLLAQRGYPMDSIDSVCKNHALCYECARMDFGHRCEPSKKDYTVIGSIDLNTGLRYLTCSNEDKCKQSICECDKMLVNGILTEYESWDSKYHIATSGFDGHASCEVPAPVHDWGEMDECCGSYPYRAPYRSDDGNRQCCNGKTYHTFYLECCNGEVRQQGYCLANSNDDDEVSEADADDTTSDAVADVQTTS